ncbi:MAG TPA: hypothetical protein VF855_04205, partial [Acidimicrobiales bacterium]
LEALGEHDAARQAAERARQGTRSRASRANLYGVSRLSFISQYGPAPDGSDVSSLYDEQIAMARELGNPAELGFILTTIAIRYSLAGDIERARPLADEAEAIARRLDNPRLWLNVHWTQVQCALIDRRDQVQPLALDMLHRSVTTTGCRNFTSTAVGFVAMGGGPPSTQHLRWQLQSLGILQDSLDWAAINMRVVGALLSLLFWGDPERAAVLIGWVGARTGGTLPGRYPKRKAAAMLGESYDAATARGAAMSATQALDLAVEGVSLLLAAQH